MNSRRTAVLSLAVVLALIMVPLCADGSDAIASDDIKLTLPGGADSVSVEVGNGSSTTFTVYVYNNTTEYYVMEFSTASDNGRVSVSATSDKDILGPVNGSGFDHIATVDVTVEVDSYMQEPSATAQLVLMFLDMADSSVIHEEAVDIAITIDSSYYSTDGNNKFLGVFPNTLDGILGSEWITAVATVIVWVVIAWIVCLLAIPLFTRIFTGRKPEEDRRRTKKTLTGLITFLIAVLAVNQCLTILGVSPEARSTVEMVSNILYIVIGAMIAWIVYVFVITGVVKGLEKGSDSAVDASILPLFKMIGKIIIAVCAVGSILAIFGVDLSGILVSAGVITLGITLGAQSILNQFFSGIVLLSTRPFKKGDFVKINNEVYIVRKVKLMFTEFDNWDKDQVVTIPNNVVSGGTIVNMTAESPEARAYVYVNVVYGTDVKKAQRLMVQAAMEHPHVIKDGSRSVPSTRLTNVQGNAVELRLAAYVDDFDSAGSYAGEIRSRIYELFDQNGIRIPPNAVEIVVDERRLDDMTSEEQ